MSTKVVSNRSTCLPSLHTAPHRWAGRILTGLLLAVALTSSGSHADDDAPDLWLRVVKMSIHFDIAADGSYVETRAWQRKVLDKRAIEGAKHASVRFSTSVQDAEVVEAYTRKADGRRVNVSRDSYQLDRESGANGGGPAFSDNTRLAVVFPDVEAGDTVGFAYRLTARQPIFPGAFSEVETFAEAMAYDDVEVQVTAPAGMALRHQVHGMQVTQAPDPGTGRVAYAWHYSNPNPSRSKRRDWSVIDIEQMPGVMLSTFPDYRAIAEAYGSRARPKAVPDARVHALADSIVKDAVDRREVARLLYEWVALNITYGGNCIGIGAVVPRDLTVILDNRMGDCKDHATLLQALLADRGIASTQALVNSGSVYRLAKMPVVSMVNHVINYIPEFELFLDATSDSTPFGMLPSGDQAKPVLLVDGFREGLRTPVERAGSNDERSETVIDLLPDGSVKVRVDVRQHGRFAVAAREAMRGMDKERQKRFIEELFRARGLTAKGDLIRDDPTALADEYHYGARFEVSHLVHRPGAGAFTIQPLVSGFAPVSSFVYGALQADTEPNDFVCSSGHSVEHYVVNLPDGLKLISVPDDIQLDVAPVSYRASYHLEGSSLTVERSLDDRTQAGVCNPEIAAAYRKLAELALPDLQAQVLYK